MQTPKSTWDVERAAAWLRRHAWGAGGEESAPALGAEAAVAAVQPEPAPLAFEEQEEIDIAGWPALVAPFYD